MKTTLILATLIGALSIAHADPAPMAEMRQTPTDLADAPTDKNQIGSSGLSGVHTKVLYGDPSKPGLYSVLLYVPANTTIQAHTHKDDRMATVVSGTWRFGYGTKFDAKKLVVLPPGSVYSEPAHAHFAQTQKDAVIVHIVGYGPTDTVYVDPANEPKKK
ncbi:MAG TPA: cupin domain-containing protein [Kofleriaceae bacterium]|jgi:uncharacterized RmlC-like cupin family protein